jgi:hypothetical protein
MIQGDRACCGAPVVPLVQAEYSATVEKTIKRNKLEFFEGQNVYL